MSKKISKSKRDKIVFFMSLGMKATEAARAFQVSHQGAWSCMHPDRAEKSWRKHRVEKRPHYNKMRRDWYKENRDKILLLRKLGRKETRERKTIQALLREKVMEKAKLMGLI